VCCLPVRALFALSLSFLEIKDTPAHTTIMTIPPTNDDDDDSYETGTL